MKIKNYQILKRYYKIINVVQIPFNIINYKILMLSFRQIKKRKIELHARSIFYQGVLLMNKKSIKSRFKSFYEKFNQLNYLSKK